MPGLNSILKERKILVSDGAWGTELMKLGLKPGGCPELWNREQPERVMAVAASYVKAGADIIETNSFGGNSIKLARYGLGAEASELNRLAAELSREAAGEDVLVMGSMGPTGKFLMTGELSRAEMYDSFSRQAMALEKGGADLLIVETMSDPEEASVAVEACVQNTGLPVVCSMSFDAGAETDPRTMMGTSVRDFVLQFKNSGAAALGSNCGKGTVEMLYIAKLLRQKAGDFPLLIQANAGRPSLVNGESEFPDSPVTWEPYIRELIRLRINIIGGCCGTNPDFIRNIRSWVDRETEVK